MLRWLHLLLGLSVLTLVGWQMAGSLRRAADAEPFAVRTEAPRGGQWLAEVRPPESHERVALALDGKPVGMAGSPSLQVPLGHLGPGLHFVEARIERRGGRVERVVDPVVLGPFGEREAERGPCGLAFSVSDDALRRALLPAVRTQLLANVRKSEHLGPGTTLTEAKFTLTPKGIHFAVALDGVNDVTASGWLSVAVKGDRSFELGLITLTSVTFEGETRRKADTTAAVVGAAVTGPLAPVGAVAGYTLMDRYVTKQARETVEKEIEKGLSKVSRFALFPESVELLPGRPASRVRLAFCDEVQLAREGVTAYLSVTAVPLPEGSVPARTWSAPGPVEHGVELPVPVLSPSEDLRLDLSVDTVNHLLDAWAVAGLLEELLGETRMLDAANAQLGAWTTVQLDGIEPHLPPVLGAGPTRETGWGVALGDLDLQMSGVGPGVDPAQRWGRIRLAGRGEVDPVWDAEAGELVLAGGLHDLSVTCAHAVGGRTELRPCLGTMLDFGGFVEQLDDQLRPEAGHMPRIALRALVDTRSEGRLALGEVEIQRPEPGVLRLVGTLEDE